MVIFFKQINWEHVLQTNLLIIINLEKTLFKLFSPGFFFCLSRLSYNWLKFNIYFKPSRAYHQVLKVVAPLLGFPFL
jgi:hypothetical protein